MQNKEQSLNHLFEKWLIELRDFALTKKDITIQTGLNNALDSLAKYPLPIKSVKDCQILRHFNSKLCVYLENQLKKHCTSENFITEKTDKKDNQVDKKKDNMPVVGTVSYAILITLYKNSISQTDYPGFMYKKDIIKQMLVDPDCHLKSSNAKTCTGWTCMQLLIGDNFVTKSSNPARFSLTKSGLDLAKTLWNNKLKSIEDYKNAPSTSSLGKSRKNDCKLDKENCLSSQEINESIVCLDLTNEEQSIEFKCNPKINNVTEGKISENNKEISDLKGNKSMDTFDKSFEEFCIENEEPIIEVKKKFQYQQNTIIKTTVEISENKRKAINDVIPTNQKKKIATIDVPSESFCFLPNNYDVILLVDNQETSGSKTKPKDDETIFELSKTGILFETRSLKVGDFTWIARCTSTNKELVLPYIVERKRVDDLCSSIIDSRYQEQKFRLKKSGIRNVIYMIENYDKNYYGAINLESLLQAGVNSLIQDNFDVKFTKNHKESMQYLAIMTSKLSKVYRGKKLISCKKEDLTDTDITENSEQLMEFSEFNKASIKKKKFTVKEMFIRQLLQIKGVSVQKAIAITEIYETPKLLVNALKNSNEKLLANIETNSSKQKIGPLISKIIYQLYTNHTFN